MLLGIYVSQEIIINFANGNSPFRSVETPVAYKPLDATAREPPRSTTT